MPLGDPIPLADLRAGAQASLDDANTAVWFLLRGIVLATLDEINQLRDWITDFRAEVAAATSLADLKARVASLPGLPERAPTQTRNAIKARIAAGDADA